MASRLRLRVVRTVLEAIEVLIREAWPLFRIYVVPWLGWTLMLIAIERASTGPESLAVPLDLIFALAFAPFGALITVGVLRWLMQPRDGFALLRFDRTWAWTTALYAIIGLVGYAISEAGRAWFMANADTLMAGMQPDSTPGQRLSWIAIGLLPSWVATLIAYLVLMPQAAVIVERGEPSLAREVALMRLAPWAILAVALLVGICRLGLSFGYASAGYRLFTSDGPLADLVSGAWRDVAIGLWRALVALPAQFLTDALALVALARVYKALAGYADRKGSATMPRVE